MKRLLAAALALPLILTVDVPKAEAVGCSNFATQEEAQAYYHTHSAANLDRDRDGIACESLPSRGSVPQPSRSPVDASTPRCASYVPKVDPWQLQKPVLLGNAKSAYYYKGVILAGDAQYVSAFLDCYNLTVKFQPNYASAYPIWGACAEINGGELSQIVCVAVDSTGREADERIFSTEYAIKVTGAIF